jgi:hypothetical protein
MKKFLGAIAFVLSGLISAPSLMASEHGSFTPASLAESAAGAVRYADEASRRLVQEVYFDCAILLRSEQYEGRVIGLEAVLMAGAMQMGFSADGRKGPYYRARDRGDVVAVDMHQFNPRTGKTESWNSFSIEKRQGRLIGFDVPRSAIGNGCMGALGKIYYDRRTDALKPLEQDQEDPHKRPADQEAGWFRLDEGGNEPRCLPIKSDDPAGWLRSGTGGEPTLVNSHEFASGEVQRTYRIPSGLAMTFMSSKSLCEYAVLVGSGNRD